MNFAARLLLATSAFVAFTTAAQAADKILTKFDQKTIDDALAAVGATDIKKDTGDKPYTVFTVDNLTYVAELNACSDKTGCLGLHIQCNFSGEGFSPTSANTFNFQHIFPNVAVFPDRKTIGIARYIIADGGTTAANVAANFKVFFAFPPLLIEQVKKDMAAPVASAAPQTTPAGAVAPALSPATAVAPAVAAITGGAQPNGDWLVGIPANKISP